MPPPPPSLFYLGAGVSVGEIRLEDIEESDKPVQGGESYVDQSVADADRLARLHLQVLLV